MKDIRGMRRRAWAEIDLFAVRENYRAVRAAVGKSTKVCCVVKADAYGHGACRLAAVYEAMGADFFAVSNLEEALELRRGGITLPILILGFTPPECAALLARENISQCVYSEEYGLSLGKEAEAAGVRVKIHLKLDTGMGRIGFFGDELDGAEKVCRQSFLIPEGVFTHFAVSDGGEEGEDYTRAQASRFCAWVEELSHRGISFAIRHCANSAAIFEYPEFHLDMVRAGIVLYGFRPSTCVRRLPRLYPVMTLRSVISHIKTLKAGESVSYGRTFVAEKPLRVATVPIGYADGFSRSLGNGRYALKIGERYAPILGRVCMDQLMVDVSEIPCSVGDTVTVLGDDGRVSADGIAEILNTINYEVTCDVSKRIPRVFLDEGEIVGFQDHLISDGE